jgi:hypothetical protein
MVRPPGVRPQGVRALIWLRSRELLGESRDPSRLVLLAIAYLGWWTLIVAGCVQAVHSGRIEVKTIPDVSAAAWPLWALIPLLGGGGGGEVVASHRLAPYPVSARAVFGAGWFGVVIDVPYVIVLPVVVGLQIGAYGWLGLLAATAFAVGASATGQLAAWLAAFVLAGRKRSGATAVLMTGAVVGLLTAAPHLLGTAAQLGHALPSGWLASADAAGVAGHAVGWLGWLALLAIPIPIALVCGPMLTSAAMDREARGGGFGSSAWGEPGWAVRGSQLRAIAMADLRSMTRAVGAQVALAGVLAVPALTQLPGVNVAEVSLIAMGSVAAIAAATVLGLNAFAFQAGGASLLLSWPAPPRLILTGKALAVGSCLLVAQLAVTTAGILTQSTTVSQALVALALIVPRTMLLTGCAMVWSVRLPASSDYDSLRARIAAPRSVISYGLAAAGCCYLVSQTTVDLPRGVGPVVLTVIGLVAGWGLLRVAETDLAGGGVERITAAVAG